MDTDYPYKVITLFYAIKHILDTLTERRLI